MTVRWIGIRGSCAVVVVLAAFLALSTTASAAKQPTLTKRQATAAAEDVVLARIGGNGTLDTFGCQKRSSRRYFCHGMGVMWGGAAGGSSTEHAYHAHVMVKLKCTKKKRSKKRCRAKTVLHIKHVAPDSSSGGGGSHH